MINMFDRKIITNHYKKARLLQGKFARENLPRKFATEPQGHCDKNNFPRKTLANLHQNSFLAKLQPICETFPKTHANPSQICDRSYRRKSVTNLQGICVRIAIPYMFVAIPLQKNR